MALTVAVTPGKRFSNSEKITIAKLNQLGQPSFTVTGTIGTSEITNGTVTAAKTIAGPHFYTSSVSFSAGDFTLTFSPTITITDGTIIAFKANAAGAPNVTTGIRLVIGASTKKLFKNRTETLVAGDIVANQIIEARYDDAGDSGSGAWQMTSHLSNTSNYYTATATGTNAYTLTLTPPATYTLTLADLEGRRIRFKVPNDNTSTCTVALTIGGTTFAAKNLYRNVNIALGQGDLKAGQMVDIAYESVADAFQMMSPRWLGELEYVHTDSGTANAYAITLGSAVTSYAQLRGRALYFRVANTNTATSTLTVSGLTSPPTIKKHGSLALSRGDLLAGGIAEVMYDGTDFQLASVPHGSACRAWVRFDGTPHAQTSAITRSGSTATFNSTGIGSYMVNGAKVNITGASQTEYNGNFVVSNVTTNSFDYTVTGSPTTPSTGTATVNTIIAAAYNVDTISDNGTGDYTLAFVTALGSTFYAVVGSAKHDGSDAAGAVSPSYNSGATAFTTTTVRVKVYQVDGAPVAMDSGEISVLVFGF